MNEPLQVVCPHCDAINRVPAARLADRPVCGACKGALFIGKPLALDEARFRRHLRASSLPLLVDFWASWCGPCQVMAPEFEAAAGMLEPTMRLVKVSTEDAPVLSQEMSIRSIPTLALMRAGAEVARQPGAMSARQIVAWARQAAG